MAISELQSLVSLLPIVRQSPDAQLWCSYDKQADVLYVTFRKPPSVTDSELTDDDIVIRYSDGEIVGYDILNASHRPLPKIA